MAENRRERDKRFYFTRGQMVLLGGAFILASVVIFFLGVFTGKGIEQRRMVKTEEPSVKFPVKNSASGAAGGRGGAGKEELTFYNTLTKPAGAKPAAEDDAAGKKSVGKNVKAESKEGDSRAGEKPHSKPAETSEANENGKTWTVQVNAFPDERSAKIWVDRLKNKGYNAYVADVNIKGKVWYRVRVGEYGSREEAKKVEEMLKTKENYTRAFVASR